MRVELVVDGKTLSLNVSSDKPLSVLLRENVEIRSLNANCNGDNCGNCIVLLDGRAVLSCLVPAFNVKNRVITTFDSFSRTREYKDIEMAYETLGIQPCQNCYASRTLLIENIVRRFEESEVDNSKPEEDKIKEILQENSLIKCFCIDSGSFIAIVNESLNNRRKRKNNVHRTKIS